MKTIQNKIIAIYGPTTSSKLSLALSLSKYIWGKYNIEPEVINVDSRKIYKEFIISQSLPSKELHAKVKTHLFGCESAKKKLSLFEFQKIAKKKIAEVQFRECLPIIVGGSILHLAAILKNWKDGEKQKNEGLPPTLVFSLAVNKTTLKKLISKNIEQMFKNGLYKEFKYLYKKSLVGLISGDLLNETLGYRQFLEMARVSKKLPIELTPKDLIKVKKWIIKDIAKYAYHQTLDHKKFLSGAIIVKNFQEAKNKICDFLLKDCP